MNPSANKAEGFFYVLKRHRLNPHAQKNATKMSGIYINGMQLKGRNKKRRTITKKEGTLK